MSNFIPHKTITIKGLTIPEQYFLYALNKLSINGESDLPNEALGVMMDLSQRTIVRYIRKLESMDIIKCNYTGNLKNHRTITIIKRVVSEDEI